MNSCVFDFQKLIDFSAAGCGGAAGAARGGTVGTTVGRGGGGEQGLRLARSGRAAMRLSIKGRDETLN